VNLLDVLVQLFRECLDIVEGALRPDFGGEFNTDSSAVEVLGEIEEMGFYQALPGFAIKRPTAAD